MANKSNQGYDWTVFVALETTCPFDDLASILLCVCLVGLSLTDQALYEQRAPTSKVLKARQRVLERMCFFEI